MTRCRRFREDRAQALVARHHIGQRRRQRRRIQPPGQPQRQRDVVGRCWALQTGSGTTAGAGRTTTASSGPRLAHAAAGRTAAACVATSASAATVGASNSARIGSSTAKAAADPADQPGGQQRVAAEVEEVVVDADPVRPSTSANRPPSISSCGVRGAPAAACGERPAPAAPCGPACRWRQRQRVQHHEGAGTM